MGSLTSRPKAPAVTPTVYYVPTSSSGDSTSADSVDIQPDAEEVAAQRVENVLRRKRSIVGNVLTSFRGVLNASSGDDSVSGSSLPRKTLLGE